MPSKRQLFSQEQPEVRGGHLITCILTWQPDTAGGLAPECPNLDGSAEFSVVGAVSQAKLGLYASFPNYSEKDPAPCSERFHHHALHRQRATLLHLPKKGATCDLLAQ